MSANAFSFCDLATPGVRDLQPYQPGKPEAELMREYGVSDVVKLASNENPLGPGPKAVAAARDALAGVHRYPDGNGFDLKRALAAHHGVPPETITLGNGSNDILDLVARVFLGPGLNAVCSAHAFAIYPIATRSAGADVIVAPANAPDHEQPYGHDLVAMAEHIDEATRVAFVANPNNPTGTWLTDDELERFLGAVPRNVVVVLDEAYIQYARHRAGYPDGTRWLDRHPNLMIARTFSKAYGLAGLRVGYALSHPDVADLMNRVRHPFNVNQVAQAAAVAALGDGAHVERTVALNRSECERVGRALRDELHLNVLPTAGNFLCVEVGDAAAVNEGLLRRGVIVRPIGGYQLPRFVRVTLGTEPENDRLLAALRELRAAGTLRA